MYPRYIFWGTPEFAAQILNIALQAGLSPIAVVCNPDRPAGRNKILTAPAVKELIQQFNLNHTSKILILQPEKLDQEFIDSLLPLHASFFVVAAYAKILSGNIISLPPNGTLGLHPSLLPKYRGASPIQSAILAGETETGVSLYKLDSQMDRGPVLLQAKTAIPSPPAYIALSQKLADLAGDLLVKILNQSPAAWPIAKVQDESLATYTKKFTSTDSFIEPTDLKAAESGKNIEMALSIYRKICALNPEPGVWTTITSKRTKLLSAEIEDNRLILKQIQKEGGVPQRP